MRLERRLYEDVAAAVAGCEEINWASLGKRISKSVITVRNLELVAQVSSRLRGESPSRARLARAPKPLPIWQRTIVWFALLQILGGLAAYAFGGRDQVQIPPLLPLATLIAFTAAAGWLFLGANGDRRAMLLGAFLLVVATAPAQRFLVWEASLLHVSLASIQIRAFLLPEAFIPMFFWLFVRDFPRLIRWGRWDGLLRFGIAASTVLGTLLFTANMVAILPIATFSNTAGSVLNVLTREHEASLYWTTLFALWAIAVGVSIARVRDAPALERRRVGFFLGGLTLGLGPMCTHVLLENLVPAYVAFEAPTGVHRALAMVLYGLLLTIPFTMAYSIVSHHVLDIRVVWLRALQRLLARSTLLWASSAMLAAFGVYLYLNRERALSTILGDARGSTFMGLGAFGLCLLFVRRPFLRALERSLFQETGVWTMVLAEAASELRNAVTAQQLQKCISSQLRKAMGVEHVLVLARSGQPSFLPVSAGRPLETYSALATVASADPKPILTHPDDSRSVFRFLPERDREWIADGNVALLAPLERSDGNLQGLLALGPRSGDVPYSKQDLLFVRAMASAAAFAIENQGLRHGDPGERADPELSAEECTRCGEVRPQGRGGCGCGAPRSEAPIPFVINGKFELRRVLGRGAMGVAYEARDLMLDRAVALKAMPRVSLEASLRLRREARSMAAVVHPHLALILGAETWRGVPILVVEYLGGGTLDGRLGRHWDPSSVVLLGVALASGLEEMHRKALVHRDVKPSNIGFAADDTPKLLDFGLARLVEETVGTEWRGAFRERGEEATSSGYAAGTPLYLPPESVESQHVSPCQDVWALALVLFELLAGRHPLKARAIADLDKPGGRRIPDIREYNPDCPSGLAETLLWALHHDRDRRLSTAAGLGQSLRRLATA